MAPEVIEKRYSTSIIPTFPARSGTEYSMPKLKTNKGAAKRFKRTGGGRLLRNKAYASHILTKKASKRKRNLRKATLLDTTNRVQIERLVPYL